MAILLAVLALSSVASGRVLASAPNLSVPAGLSIAELKVTGDEFVILMNNTGGTINDLSSYWLEDYNNVDPLAAGVNNSSEQLPIGSLAPGQTALLSSGGATCGAAVTGNLSVSLTDSGGFLEVVQTGLNANGAVVQNAGDAVSWSSKSSGVIQKVPSGSSDPSGAYYRYQTAANPPAYSWQQADVDSANSCQLNVTISGNVVPGALNPGNQLLPGTPPPATILGAASSTDGAFLPASDIGLMAPVVNELLPNPASPQTDANDEFIELYNPNTKAFDLSGFQLQTGSTTSSTRHDYSFPSGTLLPPKGFKAFNSSQTHLSLSNSGGQAWLLDPFGNTISQSGAYGTAKDGIAWALAKGHWYWTIKPTPNAANVVLSPSSSKSSSKKTSKGNPVQSGSGSSGVGSSSNVADIQPTPIHPAVLAVIAAAALLYGAYEYRSDLANRFHQFKKHRAARRETRAKS